MFVIFLIKERFVDVFRYCWEYIFFGGIEKFVLESIYVIIIIIIKGNNINVDLLSGFSVFRIL